VWINLGLIDRRLDRAPEAACQGISNQDCHSPRNGVQNDGNEAVGTNGMIQGSDIVNKLAQPICCTALGTGDAGSENAARVSIRVNSPNSDGLCSRRRYRAR
jgi:hypothetical protein